MKKILPVASLLVVAFATGCKPSDEKKAASTTAQEIHKAQMAANEAARQIKDYTYAQKAEFVVAMQNQLADLNRSLDDLAAQIDRSSAAIQAEAKPKLAMLREQVSQLKKQLATATHASESAWSTIRSDFEKAYATAAEGVTKARQWMSDTIAP